VSRKEYTFHSVRGNVERKNTEISWMTNGKKKNIEEENALKNSV
jgi:hypothetical protein